MLLLLIEYLRRKGIKIISCLHDYAGKFLTYVVVVIAKYLKLHPEDSFSMYKIQYSMLGKTKLSGTAKQLEKNIDVEMLSQCCSEGGKARPIRNLFTSIWMLTFGEHNTYRTFINSLTPIPIIKKLGYTSLSAMYSASLVFLLVDDCSVAFEFSKQIEENKTPPSMTAVFYMLLMNGTCQMIKNWNLKMCAALYLITSTLKKEALVKKRKAIDLDSTAKKGTDGMMKSKILEEFARIWNALDGNINLLLPGSRLQFYIHSCVVSKTLNKCQQKDYKQKIVSTFYPTIGDESSLSKLPFLTMILKLFSDDRLHNKDQLQKFQKIQFYAVSSNPKLRLNIEGISPYKAESMKYTQMSPYFNLLGGRRVHHGMCLIINQTFQNYLLLHRAGTEKDEQNLKRAWEYLGCKNNVEIKRDLNKIQMIKALKCFRDNLEKINPDYCVVCILSHGNLNKKKQRDEVMDANLEMVSMNKIKNMFVDGKQCAAMIGKPKLFFIQACRGKQNQNMIDTDMSETDGEENKEDMEDDGKKYINKSWFFVYQSTIKGYSSNRHPQNGTIFIQSLCKELMENGRKIDLSTIASSVNQRIMRKFNIQAPVYENQLGDFIYFQPYE